MRPPAKSRPRDANLLISSEPEDGKALPLLNPCLFSFSIKRSAIVSLARCVFKVGEDPDIKRKDTYRLFYR
jgi:hypothetical protein